MGCRHRSVLSRNGQYDFCQRGWTYSRKSYQFHFVVPDNSHYKDIKRRNPFFQLLLSAVHRNSDTHLLYNLQMGLFQIHSRLWNSGKPDKRRRAGTQKRKMNSILNRMWRLFETSGKFNTHILKEENPMPLHAMTATTGSLCKTGIRQKMTSALQELAQ